MTKPSSNKRLSALVLSCASSICLVSGFALSNGPGPTSWGKASRLSSVFISGERSSSALSMAQRRGRPRGPLRTIEVKPTMNDEITYESLRVVTPNPKGKDEALGIMSKAEALDKAKSMGGLDLILINENSDPPVCKIVDYSKYRYMKEKKAKELKKNSKATEVKEVKMSYKIDVHDYNVRKKNASKFIKQGNRVKCTVMFKGREVQHDKLGYELLEKLADDLNKICLMENKPKRDGRNLSCIITPKPELVKSINEEKRKLEKQKRKQKEKSLRAMEEKKERERELAKMAAVGGMASASLDVNDLDLSEDDDDDSSLDDLLGDAGLGDDLFA